MRLLITGGTGMLGSALKRVAGKSDIEILAPNRAELDLLDAPQVNHFFNELRPEAVIHTAARVGGISANIAHPVEFLTENIDIDNHVLGAAHRSGVENLIYVGSSCMYPKDTPNPMKVDQLLSGRLEPTNEGYAIAKLVGTKHAQYVAESTSWAWRTLVLSNLYGPGDHFEPSRSHLLAAIIQKVIAAMQDKSPSIQMWGDGSVRREFTFVEDVANFMIQSLTRLKALPLTMNIGSGIDYSVLEYYRLVIEVLEADLSIESDLSKPVGMFQKLLDIETATDFGWKSPTSIESGLKATIDWYLSANGILLANG